MRHPFRRRSLLCGIVGVTTLLVAPPPASVAATPPSGPVAYQDDDCNEQILNIVAHPDDDLLFLSPDLLEDIRSGNCVETIFITGDDTGDGADRMYEKEEGIRESYAWMAQVRDDWTETIDDQTARWSLHDADVDIVSLRLPDGGFGTGDTDDPDDQPGYPLHEHDTLGKLWAHDIDVLANITETQEFTFDDLVETLAEEIETVDPTEIRIQDKRGTEGDHPDHNFAALFAYEAAQAAPGNYSVVGYRDYDIADEPENVSDRKEQDKREAFFRYAGHDDEVCQSSAECSGTSYDRWMSREYIYSEE